MNLLNVARYIGDARAQELPLLGGEDSIHDWWYLLINWDLLPRDLTIARWVHFAGVGRVPRRPLVWRRLVRQVAARAAE